MKPLQIPFEEGRFYHVFNRGNNGDNLFYNTENYKFFLRRLDEYLCEYIELYSFCLLPNHFHLLIRIKERGKDALRFQNAKRFKDSVSLAFLKMFTSYSKAINKQQKRHGSLFENPFKRKLIDNTQYLANLIFYIHANPQLHGMCDDFRQYPWSSYERIIVGRPSKLMKDEVISWFSNKENYLAYHAQKTDIEVIRDLMLD